MVQALEADVGLTTFPEKVRSTVSLARGLDSDDEEEGSVASSSRMISSPERMKMDRGEENNSVKSASGEFVGWLVS